MTLRTTRAALLGAAALLLAGSPAFAADNFTLRDAGGIPRTMRSKDTGTAHVPFHGLAKQDGTPVDPATNCGEGSTGAAVPPCARLSGANSSGNLTGIIQADGQAHLKITTAVTTQVIAANGSKKTFITYAKIRAGGAANVNLVYGTGTNCGTGTTDLTDAEPLTASDGWVGGSGLGPILTVPASQAVCLKSDAAVTVTTLLSYTQF